MTITENINRIKQAKEDIKDAIIAKGVEVADDVRIDGYAAKIVEIQQGGGGSQFAIDYGEEIYTNNAYSMTAEQEDIDYYNQIQAERAAYAAGTGGRSDAEIQADLEFKRKIAWWPKGMKTREKIYSGYEFYTNIRSLGTITMPSNSTSFLSNCFNFTDVERLNFDIAQTMTRAFSVSGVINFRKELPAATNTSYMFTQSTIMECDIVAPLTTDASYMFYNCKLLRKVHLVMPVVRNMTNSIGGSNVEEAIIEGQPTNVNSMFAYSYKLTSVEIDLGKVDVANNDKAMFTGLENLKTALIKGLHVNLMIERVNKLQLSSVKYILDNCQARADGAAYTLTLHANVKAAFMAKCTEGDENYDAEYAATLAAANEKGLTIA